VLGTRQLTLAMALAAVLAIWSAPAAAETADGFQFNELDFDRQGTGQGPAPARVPAGDPLGLPGDARDPDAGLADLFSGDPAPETGGAKILNLPDEPSPVSVPAAQGEAKIELAGQAPKAAAPRRTARASSRAQEPSFRNMQERRFYYAMQAWRNHPEVNPVNCQSYLSERPLYHVRCLGALARR
jgi:hypothetical protein